jgi:hypothetical protein
VVVLSRNVYGLQRVLLLSVQTGAITLVSWLMLFLLFSLSSIYGSYTFGELYNLVKTLLLTLAVSLFIV